MYLLRSGIQAIPNRILFWSTKRIREQKGYIATDHALPDLIDWAYSEFEEKNRKQT